LDEEDGGVESALAVSVLEGMFAIAGIFKIVGTVEEEGL
jgi:hypothetical protein